MASSSSSSSAAESAAAAGDEAAGGADDVWDPWDRVAFGTKDKTSKEHLQSQFTATSCGGLECKTCSFHVPRGDVEERTPSGVAGILTNHLRSKKHAAGVQGQQNKAAGRGLHAFLRPKHAAAAASSAAPAAPGEGPGAGAPGARAGAAPAGPRARPAPPLLESGDEADEAVVLTAAASVIDSFRLLPPRSRASVAQHMTAVMKRARCKGFRPPSLEGVVDLLTHVPTAYFYASGSYGTTNLERVAGKLQLRQHNFHAVGCLEFADAGSDMCSPCRAVDPSTVDKRMPYLNQPVTVFPAKTNDAHYSAYQMKEKKDAVREEDGRKRLTMLTLKRKVHRQERALGLHERLMVALTSGNARMLQSVLMRAWKAGLGVAATLKQVTKCLEGVYRPRPQFTELDMGIASLMYIFGGAAGAYAANKGLGLPCERLIRKSKELAAFVPIIYTGALNYAADVKKAVVANLRASFGQPILEGKIPWRRCFAGQWMMALDGTANDKTLSFHSQTGTIIGGCEHKPDEINLVLTTPDDGKAVIEAVERGQKEPASARAMHLVGETVVICFKPITATGEEAPFLPAAAVPTCNKRTCLKMSKELLTGALDGFDALREFLREEGLGPEVLGDVVTIGTDGDAKRRRALTALCNVLEGRVPAVEVLRALDLFDTYGGELQVTVDFDMRHMIKRIRVRLVFTDRGMQLSPLGVKFERAKVKELFEGYSVPHLASVFDNTDKQNVPAAVNLLHGFRWVADALKHEIPFQKNADVLLLAALGDHLLRPMIGGVDGQGTEVSLEDALVSYAAAAFLLLVIFVEMGSSFIPPQLYHDLQSSIKNLYVVVGRQLEDPKNEGTASLLFFLLGTDEVEKLFGTLRRLSPGLTFTVLQLLERIGAAALVHAIYAMHPDLDPGSRRLEGSRDKVNAASWQGTVKVVGDGILLSCWQKGRRVALDVLGQHYHYGAKETVDGVEMTRAERIIRHVKEKGGSMMRPRGQLVGVSVEEGGDLEIGGLEEEGMEGDAARTEGSEEAGAGEAWGDAVRASLVDMEGELHAGMAREQMQALETLASGGVADRDMQAAAAAAHRAAERKLYFDLPEGKKHKAQWLREEMGKGGVGTTRFAADRVARYQGMEKGAVGGGTGAGGSGRRKVVAAEMDEPMVELGDPVVFPVLKGRDRQVDKDLRMVTVKGTLGVGVGEIVGLQNKEQGRGRLAFLREDLFMAADTTVQVRPIQVAAVGTAAAGTGEDEGVEGSEAVLELVLEEYTTREPFTFKGGRLVGLLKPEVVQKEDGTRTQHVFQIDAIHLRERLALFAEEVRLQAVDGARGLQGLPVHRDASVAQAGSVEVALWKEKDEKVVRCEPCLRGPAPSDMERAQLRHHAAGHHFLPSFSSPRSLCGFCGLELAETRCSVEVKDGKLLSTCSFNLPRFKYRVYARERKEELQQRLALGGEAAVADATKAGLGLGAPKAGKCTVQNIPIPCPMPGCSSVIWKLNLIPHLLEGEHPLPMEGRAQRWRRRGRTVLKELQVLLTSAPRAEKTYALGEGALQQVADKLEEVRDLLAVAGWELSVTVSFCLEEVVRESQAALSKYYTTRGPYTPRAERKDKGKKKGKGKGGGGGDDSGAAAAAQAVDSEGSEDEEDEEEGEEERNGAGGQSNGKRPADGEGVGSADKAKKPKK